MKTLLLTMIVALVAHQALAADTTGSMSCRDAQLTSAAYGQLKRGSSFSQAIGLFGCSPQQAASYTDGKGQAITIYVFHSPNKSVTASVLTGLIYELSATNLDYVSAAPSPSFNLNSWELYIPILDVTDSAKTFAHAARYFNVGLVLSQSGNYAISRVAPETAPAAYDSNQPGGAGYDLCTYRMAIPSMRLSDGTTMYGLLLELKGGRWKLLDAAADEVSCQTAVTPAPTAQP